ncbi:MAG: hypothetical protein J5I47_02935 [Vicingus serpentipes]|nr:hypothetical protein [Vicingus serpentipes]
MHNITGIKNFEFNKETCFICGRYAESREHLFPKWLQHRFNLWDEKLIIPNKTAISYRQLIVPCCKKCNGEVFGQLEKVIASGTESESDIWRWANKLHFGLTLKDKFFDWDRKNPGYKIGDIISSSDPLEQSRHFLHAVSGDFKCNPDPFGSVFRFDFKKEQEYNFIHIINSSSICISLGNRGYVIFVRDGQFLKECEGVMDDYKELQSKDSEMVDMLFFYAKNIEYLERFTITNPVIITKGQIIKLGRATIREERPENKELLAEICKHFGFTWVEK